MGKSLYTKLSRIFLIIGGLALPASLILQHFAGIPEFWSGLCGGIALMGDLCCLIFYRISVRAAPHNSERQIAKAIFRQMRQKAQRTLDMFAKVFVKYDKKIVSETMLKLPDANCAVLP